MRAPFSDATNALPHAAPPAPGLVKAGPADHAVQGVAHAMEQAQVRYREN